MEKIPTEKTAPARKTPLHEFHGAHGGRMVDFAGWLMPVQYRGILEEHKAVRGAAGLFDVSHMGEIDVQGPDARRFLDHLVTNDVSKLYPGRVLYSPMCDESGGVIDDLLIYKRADDDYLLCVNASNTAVDLGWLRQHASAFDVTVTDRSADYALLALQGPKAAAILAGLTAVDLSLIRYYHFGEGLVADVPCLVSRTGYTGEDGFELYHRPEAAPRLAAALLKAGEAQGLQLAGLGARDSLRLEAGYPLHGHEISPQISPLTAGIGWAVKLKKPEGFIGAEALRAEQAAGSAQRVVFFKTGGRRIVRPEARVSTREGRAVGRVLSGTLSPVLLQAIGSALVEAAAPAAELGVDFGAGFEPVTLLKPPFVTLPPKP